MWKTDQTGAGTGPERADMSDRNARGQGPRQPGDNQRQPIFLLPGIVTILAGLMIAIHLAETIVLNEMSRLDLSIWFGFLPLRLLSPEAFPGGYWPLLWTPFTHAFLHASFEHLALNVLWLAIFATPVARRYGAVSLLILFLATSAAGALAFAATTLPEVSLLIGASGGVAGLTGAAIRFMFQPVLYAVHPETGERMLLGRRLASIREVLLSPPARNFAFFWIVINAAVPLLPLFTGAEVSVAWQAHLGGFFAGFFLVPLFERRQSAQEHA